MSVQVANLEEKNMVQLTIEVPAEELEKALQAAYNRQKKNISIPGFRKGKVPMNIIERTYGPGIFYEDAANDIMQGAYEKAVEESGLDIVSRPEVDVTQIGKGQNFIFTATVAVKPEVTLGEYKGLEVEKDSIAVSDEEVDAELKKAQEKNAREVEITDRPIKEGDIIKLNYAGTIDGVPFDGGTADNQSLVIGSHSFIDTFEDQLVGLNIGDTKDVEVTFPEEYHAADLAGKPAVFHCEILGITEKQLDEINDDFVQDTTEFDSLEEYKTDIRAKLALAKEESAVRAMTDVLVGKVVENATMDIPEAMIDTEVEQMVTEFKQRVAMQGLSFEQYLQYTGGNMDALKESMKPQAESRVKGTLVLEAVAAAENLEVTEEDLDKEFEKMASMYQMEVEQIKSFMPAEQTNSMKESLKVQKAIDFLVENANVTEASEELEFEAE